MSGEEIELSSDGISRLRLGDFYKARDGRSTELKREFQLSCDEADVRLLSALVHRLADASTPNKQFSMSSEDQARPVSRGLSAKEMDEHLVVVASHRGEATAKVVVPLRAYERHPVWRGLYEECRQAGGYLLARGLLQRDVAEMYRQDGQLQLACLLYESACKAVIRWDHITAERSPIEYISEGELLLRDPHDLNRVGRYEDAVNAFRKAWNGLADGITVREWGGVSFVTVRPMPTMPE
jgi:hypothetical protein